MAETFPPIIGIVTADPSGWLAAMDAIVASTEEAMAAVDASLSQMSATADAAFAGTATAAETSAAASTSAWEGAQAKLAGFGTKAGLVAAAASAAVVWMAGSFQSQMLLIQTQAGASSDEVDRMSQAILNLAPAVGDSPKKLAEALFPIESVGLRDSAALDALTLAAEGAKVGHADLTETANALSAVLASGIPGVSSATEAMGAMNAMVGLGKMKMSDLNSALSSGILDSARTFGVSLQSVGAALDQMTSSGVPADQAATRLRMSLALMAAPTKQAAGILETLGLDSQQAGQQASAMAQLLAKAGVTTTQLASDLRQPDGIAVALQDLKGHMDDAGLSAEEQAAVISRAFGGGRMGTAIMSMSQHVDELQTKFAGITDASGNFDSAWQATQATFDQQWSRFLATVQTLAVELGTKLLPALTTTFKWLSQHKDVVIALAAGIGGVLLVAIGAFIASLSAATLIAAGLAAAVGALVAGVVYAYEHFQTFHDILDGIGRAIASTVKWVYGFFDALVHGDWGKVKDKLAQLWGNITSWVTTGAEWLGAHLVEWGKAFGNWIVTTALPWLGQELGALLSWLGSWITGTALPWIGTHLEDWAIAFYDWVENALEQLPGKLEYFAGYLVGWLVGMAGRLGENMLTWSLELSEWLVKTALPWLIQHAIQFQGALLSWVASLPGRIASFAGQLVSAITDWIVNAAEQAPGKLWQFGLNVMNWLQALPGAVRSWIGDAGSWLLSAGEDVVRGLWNGISNMGQWIKDQVGNFASGIIDGFKSAFGIKSPSTVMMSLGQFMGEGLHLGLLNSMPTDIGPYVPNLGANLGGTAGHGVGSGSAASTAAAPRVQNIHNEIKVTNPMPTADDIAKAISWQMKR